ncbi:hypothetical protein NONO_c73610 [Nocardia nova SH22a]|uniref:Uncharacterized protein n=1 Tax=Nocardia nova SH22a TaxID=1415166 RepID=W5TS55_9NOCA|nr:hypothetical protein [Nocardia nova]AHH22117.1 hypothetical protein NONO_c73610 [Nocardia nova SH22a]
MSTYLRRHWPLAKASWRDLDANHARPDEDPIRPPWRKTNMNRHVWLQSNMLCIADYSDTVFQLGGVSYDKEAFTRNWSFEFDLNCDGNIIQEQFWGAAISSSWVSVAFTELQGYPIIAIHRDALSSVNTIRIMVYHALNTIETLAETGTWTSLMNKTWYRLRVLIDRDRLVRVYINTTLALQYWLPAEYASGLGRRAVNYLNQTSATSYQANYELSDRPSDFPTMVEADWALVKSDDFARSDGAVGNGWTQVGANAGIVGGKWASTGTSDGSRALLADTGATDGRQRVDGVFGAAPNGTADCSLLVRVASDGTTGLAANYYSGRIYLSRFTGGLTAPTMVDYVSVAITLDGTLPASLQCDAQHAWVEIGGAVVLMADLNEKVAVADSWAGARVERASGVNSPSWDQLAIYRAA